MSIGITICTYLLTLVLGLENKSDSVGFFLNTIQILILFFNKTGALMGFLRKTKAQRIYQNQYF